MPLVFYDTETTGREAPFDQILQFAAIKTNYDLEIENPEQDVVNLRCRRLPHIVPSPGALMVRNLDPRTLDETNRSYYEMVREIAVRLREWSPSVFCGYNNIKFDEAFLRQAFYQTLHPIYLTNQNGSYRADIMKMIHAVAAYAPGQLTFPRDDRGRPIFKLGELVRANGIKLSEAEEHDALNDVHATIELARLIKRKAEEMWNAMMQNALHSQIDAFLENNHVFYLTNFFPTGLYNEAVAFAGRNAGDEKEIAVFNLARDPARYLDLDRDGLLVALGASPKVIRTFRSNAQPIVMPFSMTPDKVAGGRLPYAEYEQRMRSIRADAKFQQRLGEALVLRYTQKEPSPHVEERIYDGFREPPDEELCARFHEIPWQSRLPLCDRFADPRLREISRRLIYLERSDLLAPAERARMEEWVAQRLLTEDDVPWMTIPKALIELGDIRRRAVSQAQERLRAIGDYLESLAARHR